MTKVPNPEELKKLRVIIPTSRLVLWAESSGFETRRGTGSHIVCRHTKYPDVFFTVVHDTEKLDSKRNFANALLEIRKRESAKTIPTESFSKASDDEKFEAIVRKLPHYIEAQRNHKTGQIILRDRNLPQLGLTLLPGEDSMIENKARYLEGLKREVFVLLGRARANFDINTKFTRGVFGGTLSHSVYRNLAKMEISAYAADEPTDKIFTAIQDYMLLVEYRDIEHQIRLEDALSSDAVRSVQVAFNARRGARSNQITLTNPNDGTVFNFEFTTKSHQRATVEDVSGRISGAQLKLVENMLANINGQTKSSAYTLA